MHRLRNWLNLLVYNLSLAMKKLLSMLLVFLSLIGIADAGYITYEEIRGVIPPCGNGFDCGAVLNSPWANIGPVPLAAVGVVFYSWIFLLAILNFLEFSISPIVNQLADQFKLKPKSVIRQLTLHELLLASTTFGAGFSAYLVFIMAVPIGAWCRYCLVSAATCASLFITMSIYYHKTAGQSPFLLKKTWYSIFHFLYLNIIKPIFFLFDPETIHNLMVSTGVLLGKFGIFKLKTQALFKFTHPILGVKFDGITFPNRIGLSAGFDYDGDLTQILPSVGFGWHTIGTVTLEPYEGNPKPRLGRLPDSKALIVNKGLKSVGARAVIAKLAQLPLSIPTAISIASTNKKFTSEKEQILEILACFRLFESSQLKHQLYELNISCPNTFGGEPFTTPMKLEKLLSAVDSLKLKLPVYAKMPIDQSEAETLALLKVIDKHQVAGVIFGNLTKDKNNPAVTKADREIWQQRQGNLSGKPTWDRSNKLIALTKKHFKNRFTIVGTGGIFTPEDAKRKLALGADLLQMITGMIYGGPQTIGMINLGLALDALSPSDGNRSKTPA